MLNIPIDDYLPYLLNQMEFDPCIKNPLSGRSKSKKTGILVALLLCAAISALITGASYLPRPTARTAAMVDLKKLSELAEIDTALKLSPDETAAISSLESRIKRDPEAALTIAELARSYLSLGTLKHDHSLIELAESRALESLKLASFQNFIALETLARAASYRHDFTRAKELSNQMIESGAYQGYEILISALLAQKDLETAHTAAIRFSESAPGFSSWIQMGAVLEAKGDITAAEKYYLKALAASSGADSLASKSANLWSRSIVARFYLKRSLLQEGEAILIKVLEFEPNYPLAVGLLGELQMLKGEHAAAAKSFKRAFRLTRDPYYLEQARRLPN